MKQSIFTLSIFIAALILTTTSCSKKPVEMEEEENSLLKAHSGGVYMQCDMGPYFYNIDSLISNCSINGNLDHLLLANDSIKGPISTCNYDSDAYKLANQNWDFKVVRGTTGYQLEWNKTPLLLQPAEAQTISEGGKYPFIQFHNGFEIQISENKVLTILLFYAVPAGCLHDCMIWEFVADE